MRISEDAHELVGRAPLLLSAFCSVPHLVPVIILLPLGPTGAWGYWRAVPHIHLTTLSPPQGTLAECKQLCQGVGPAWEPLYGITTCLFPSLPLWPSSPYVREREVPLWTKGHSDMVEEGGRQPGSLAIVFSSPPSIPGCWLSATRWRQWVWHETPQKSILFH